MAEGAWRRSYEKNGSVEGREESKGDMKIKEETMSSFQKIRYNGVDIKFESGIS